MTSSEMFLMAIGLAIIVIAIFLVPVLIQLRRVGEKAEILLDSLNHDIPPLLKNLNDSASELHTLSTALNRRVEEVEQILSLARNASDHLLNTTGIFKTLLPYITKIGGFGAGLFTFISYLRRSRHNNKEED
jgi:predicted PurR-regulated permease PerM